MHRPLTTYFAHVLQLSWIKVEQVSRPKQLLCYYCIALTPATLQKETHTIHLIISIGVCLRVVLNNNINNKKVCSICFCLFAPKLILRQSLAVIALPEHNTSML